MLVVAVVSDRRARRLRVYNAIAPQEVANLLLLALAIPSVFIHIHAHPVELSDST